MTSCHLGLSRESSWTHRPMHDKTLESNVLMMKAQPHASRSSRPSHDVCKNASAAQNRRIITRSTEGLNSSTLARRSSEGNEKPPAEEFRLVWAGCCDFPLKLTHKPSHHHALKLISWIRQNISSASWTSWLPQWPTLSLIFRPTARPGSWSMKAPILNSGWKWCPFQSQVLNTAYR